MERRFLAAVVATLVGLTVLLVWNVFQYDWLRGYDAWHNSLYVETLRDEHRLPTRDESGSSHNPPLFFVTAVVLESLAAESGWPNEPRKLVQLTNAGAAVGIALFAFLTARELFPRSRTAQFATLAFAALAPVLARAAVMYHYEALGALFATAALYAFVRAWVRGHASLGTGAVVGVLLALALLTRTQALAVLAGLAFVLLLSALRRERRSDATRMGVAMVVTAIGLAMPWFAYQQLEHGGPFDLSRDEPDSPLFERRPATFYTDLGLPEIFSEPYAPHFLNRFFPTVYADWWGDYWRYYGLPHELTNEPPRLPKPYRTARVIQSFVGVLPTLLIATGLGLLAWRAVRGGPAVLAAAPATVVVLALAYVYFQQRYPYHDADTLKAIYLLSALAPASIAGGFALERVRRASGSLFTGLAAALTAAAGFDLGFLVLR
jgi:hypothetical protein